jgi:REP element-mobilizing transposase RayT
MGPIAYLITFRCHGTWLPGDRRGYIRHGSGGFGAMTSPSPALESAVRSSMKRPPFALDAPRRAAVREAIRGHCHVRGWHLRAIEVRLEHVHVVVKANAKPERILLELKAWTTRRMRELRLMGSSEDAWSRHGSTRYLWTEEAVDAACRYVAEGQGAALP